jgi:hypothetical protein
MMATAAAGKTASAAGTDMAVVLLPDVSVADDCTAAVTVGSDTAAAKSYVDAAAAAVDFRWPPTPFDSI